MSITLSSLGWVADKPEGNRLRWSLNPGAVVDDRYVGLPDRIVVQRAPVEGEKYPSGAGQLYTRSGTIPPAWWDSHGSQSTLGLIPKRYALPEVCQAIRFRYRGHRARMFARFAGNSVLERTVSDGEYVLLEAAFIDELVFLSFSASLESVRTLNLYQGHGLHFENIANINMRGTLDADYEQAYERYQSGRSLDQENWDEFQQKLMPDALDSKPADVLPEGVPPAWTTVETVLAMRWQIAVLYGHGFVDGPGCPPDTSLDDINRDQLLRAVPSLPMAYRVLAYYGENRKPTASNITVCPPWIAADLMQPAAPNYSELTVRLQEDENYLLKGKTRWSFSDPRADGLELEERVSPGSLADATGKVQRFEFRSRQQDEQMSGELVRDMDVHFYDVTLSARARTTDSWDRVSIFSAWSAEHKPNFIHNAPPPVLGPAAYAGGTVSIELSPRPDPVPTPWAPDHASAHTAGTVLRVYRQLQPPAVVPIVVASPVLVSEQRYSAQVFGAVALNDFEGGYLTVGSTRIAITDVAPGKVFFEPVGDSESTLRLFDAGAAKLQQSITHPSLWTAVAMFDLDSVGDILSFTDVTPDPQDTARIDYYRARVELPVAVGPDAYLGEFSNHAQIMRIPETPVVPPPFYVETLGVDFYNRTMIRVRLNDSVPVSNKYQLSWANGVHDASSFADVAAPGVYGDQQTHESRYLYDVLPLPVPRNREQDITIGLQQVNGGGGISNYQVVNIGIQPG